MICRVESHYIITSLKQLNESSTTVNRILNNTVQVQFVMISVGIIYSLIFDWRQQTKLRDSGCREEKEEICLCDRSLKHERYERKIQEA